MQIGAYKWGRVYRVHKKRTYDCPLSWYSRHYKWIFSESSEFTGLLALSEMAEPINDRKEWSYDKSRRVVNLENRRLRRLVSSSSVWLLNTKF